MTTSVNEQAAAGHRPTVHYTVDSEEQTTSEHELTPVQILRDAGIDAASHHLVQIRGQTRESYEAAPNELIKIHQKMVFISVFTGPTPVS